MIAIVLCILAFVVTYWAGKRSLGEGLIALLVFGYFYGILRANLITAFSHFIFDTGLVGLYLSQNWSSSDPRESRRLEIVKMWMPVLLGWPLLMVLMPFQPLLVSIVGLRGHVFFIPLLMLGTKLKERDLHILSGGLAVLNLIAVAFAGAEYFRGVPRFYPYSPVTTIIYASSDVAGGFFRIPAIFSSAHAYGGTMVGTMPFLIGGWQRAQMRTVRILALAGIAAALLGVLMSATRLNFILGMGMVLFTILTSKLQSNNRVVFLLVIAALAWTALSNERFQRFKSLGDSEMVVDRLAGSVNRSFFELLAEHPMGNGLGGGGTSVPYFLQGQVKNPIGLESEYSRILCEQGFVGLLLWLAFIAWFLSRAAVAFLPGSWANSRRLAWCYTVISMGTGLVGTGLLTAIPGTVLLLLCMGWTMVPQMTEYSRATAKIPVRLPGYRPSYVPVAR